MKKFSIIIPVYNGERFISETINNILNQNFNNFEVILVNDGSNDNTLIELLKYSAVEKISVVSYQKNKGVSYARNVGIRKAEGEFLLFLDSDDYLDVNCLTELNKILRDKNIDIISFGFVKSQNNVIINYSNKYYDKQYFTSDEFLQKYFTRKIAQCMCSFVCRKNIIIGNKISFSEDVFFAEDQEFQIRCMFHSNIIYYTSFPFFKYNIQESSVMNSSFSIKRLTSLQAFLNLFPLFSDRIYLKKLFTNYFYYNYFGLLKYMLKSNVDLVLLTSELEKRNKKFSVNKPYLLSNKISFIVNFLYHFRKFLYFFFKRIINSKYN